MRVRAALFAHLKDLATTIFSAANINAALDNALQGLRPQAAIDSMKDVRRNAGDQRPGTDPDRRHRVDHADGHQRLSAHHDRHHQCHLRHPTRSTPARYWSNGQAATWTAWTVLDPPDDQSQDWD